MKRRREHLLAVAAAVAWALAGDATLGQGFRVEPYLQNPTSDAITVRWLSDTADPGSLTIDGRTFASSPTLAPGSTRPGWIPTRANNVNGVATTVDQYLATERTGYTQNDRDQQLAAKGFSTLQGVIAKSAASLGSPR